MNNQENNDNRIPKIGEIYMVNFSGSNNEQTGYRPGIIIQNNTGNAFSPNVIVIPLTTSLKKACQPTHVIIYAHDSSLIRDSMALCENPECISKSKLDKYIGVLSDDYMEKIASAFILATSIVSFITPELFCVLRQKADLLNTVSI